MAQAWIPNTWEAEAGRWPQCQPGLQRVQGQSGETLTARKHNK